MKQQDKLRHSLQEFYDNRPEPYNDQAWERASDYLRAARRKRRIRGVVIMMATLLSGLFLTLFIPRLLSTNENYKAASGLTHSSDRHVNAPEFTLAATEEHKSSSSDKPSKINKTFIENPGSSQAPDQVMAVKSNIRASESKKKPENNNILSEEKINTPLNVTSTINKAPGERKDHAGKSSQKKHSHTPEKNMMEVKPDVVDVFPAKHEDQAATTYGETILASKDMPVSTNDTHDLSKIPADSGHINDVHSQTISTLATATIAASNDLNSSVTEKELPEKNITLADTPEGLELSASSTTPVSTSFTVTEDPDEIKDDTSIDSSFVAPLSGEGFFYEAGLAWYYGWNGPVKHDARGFSPVPGIHYMNRINDRCALSFGVQYMRMPHLSGSSKTSRISSYGYGEESRVTVVTPSVIHYIVAPLRFYYHTNRKNCFGAGINLAYLLTVDATVTSYDERPGFNGNKETAKLSGYTDGFSWFDSQVAFCYRRKIGSSLGFQAEAFLGLTDVKQNAFFKLDQNERNSGAKLSLIYYAFRKK